jgi:hypothetical protein
MAFFVSCILFIITIITIIPSSFSLFIYVLTSNTTVNYTPTLLPSLYSTLGGLPAQSINANVSYISSKDIDEERCTINNKNISNQIVVFTDATLPSMYGCNHDPLGTSAAFGRMVQGHGGIAIVLSGVDTVCVVYLLIA